MLMRERSVSHASERLDMSQSATSEMLSRLRDRFNDPLLVRGRDGMVPTPRALELLPDIRTAIENLRKLLNPSADFDIAGCSERFRLTMTDYTQLILATPLVKKLEQEAPHCNLDILTSHILRVEESLESGELDLAIAYYPSPPLKLRHTPLFSDQYVLVMRAGHPALGSVHTAERFAALPHIKVAPSGLSYLSAAVDSGLRSQGLTRRLVVSSPHFFLAAHLASQTELVLALPNRIASRVTAYFPLVTVAIPFQTDPITVSMYWHERSQQSKSHNWLRAAIREILMAS